MTDLYSALDGIEPAYRAACSDYHDLGCTADRCVMDGGKCEYPDRYRVRAALAAALADSPETMEAIAWGVCPYMSEDYNPPDDPLPECKKCPMNDGPHGGSRQCRVFANHATHAALAALRYRCLGDVE